MKTRTLCRMLIPLLFISLAFVSCNDNDSDDFDVYADAYIVKKQVGEEVRTAVAFYAYASAGMASVTVIPPIEGGDSFELNKTPESSLTFFREPADAEFSTGLPPVGIYQFEVTSTAGETVLKEEELEVIGLDIPQIDSAKYQPGNGTLKVNWEGDSSADGYVIKLLDEDGMISFISFAVAPTAKEFFVHSTSGTWELQPVSGDNMTLQVQAFAYDSGAISELNIYNIGEIAIAERDIIWGQ